MFCIALLHRTSGHVFSPQLMPPKREPAVNQWAYDHEHVGGTEYCFHWDHSRGPVTKRQRTRTGWIICTAAYAGDAEVPLPPVLEGPFGPTTVSSISALPSGASLNTAKTTDAYSLEILHTSWSISEHLHMCPLVRCSNAMQNLSLIHI